MQDNITSIISKTINIDRTNLKNIKELISKIKEALQINKDNFDKVNKIDKNKNGAITIDFNVIDNIFTNLEKENHFFGDEILSQKDSDSNIIYGKRLYGYGNVVVISDGNPYITIEMAIRNIMAGNTSIFVNTGYMFATNKFIVELIGSVLEQYDLSRDFVSLYVCDEYEEVLNNYSNIDLVIAIGNNALQREVLKKSNNKVITSGYECFDLYMEDKTNLDFINTIVSSGVKVNLYIKEDLNLTNSNAIKVANLDEAIAQINYTGGRYSASIFTNNSENASKFIKEVKSKIVTVNTSPTIERILDIKQSDLMTEKTIIYPVNHKFDGSTYKIELNEKDN